MLCILAVRRQFFEKLVNCYIDYAEVLKSFSLHIAGYSIPIPSTANIN